MYPETFEKVIASGKTPAGAHVPVLVDESLDALRLEQGIRGVDCTLGYGGHAQRILEHITPGGRLLGLDIDPIERPRTLERLRSAGWGEEVFDAVRSNYAGLAKVLATHGWPGVDFVFADLGCSSMQLDDPTRGFTFKQGGPLDMRMNPERGLSAADWLQRVAADELEETLRECADEPRAAQLAPALAGRRFATTAELADAVRSSLGPRISEDDLDLAVRRVFQAVRIAVNDEFGAIDAFLRALPGCLLPGGRAVILTFHSGEDRRVKKAFQAGLRDGFFSAISENVVQASPEERRRNPRSIPAKMRWAIRADA